VNPLTSKYNIYMELLQLDDEESLADGGLNGIGEGKVEEAVHAERVGKYRCPLRQWRGEVRASQNPVGLTVDAVGAGEH